MNHGQPESDLRGTILPPQHFIPAAGEADVESNEAGNVEPFRPRKRPPIPVLAILDDNQRSSELVRIRRPSFVIGRTTGDLTIPLDAEISSSHAKLYVSKEQGRFVWKLSDLESRNGTFIRVSKITLAPDRVIMLGKHYLHIAMQSSPDGEPGDSEGSTPSPQNAAALVDVDSKHRYPLTGNRQWIGRGPSADIDLADPLISLQHARIWRDDKLSWHLRDVNSRNGIWVRIHDVPLESGGVFQCGEQRFKLMLP